jgi:hypothetical protein
MDTISGSRPVVLAECCFARDGAALGGGRELPKSTNSRRYGRRLGALRSKLMRMWFTEDAAPHLAEATARNYLQVANTWIRPIAGSWPLRAFEKPRAVNELLRQAQVQGVERLDASGRPTGQVDTAHRPTVDPIRKILSSALIRGDRLRPTGQRVVSGGGASISDEQIASRRRRATAPAGSWPGSTSTTTAGSTCKRRRCARRQRRGVVGRS